MKKKREEETTEECLYRLGWISIVVLVIIAILYYYFGDFIRKHSFPCIFHATTGYYCPGCGGTRAVKYFLTGHFIKSFIYHPLITYIGFGGIIFMVSQTIERLSKGKIKGIKFKNIYAYLLIVILVVQFIFKNVLVYFYHYHII